MALSEHSTEEWRTIPDWEMYEASSLGRIRRLHKHTPPRVVKSRLNRFGYPEIGLKRKGERQRFILVHRLIAAAFVGMLPDGYQVDHRNGNRTDNAPDNLEYVTPSENVQRALKANPKRPRTPSHVIADVRGSECSDLELSIKWGISPLTVYYIRKRSK